MLATTFSISNYSLQFLYHNFVKVHVQKYILKQSKLKSIHVNRFENLQDPERCMLARKSSSLYGSFIFFSCSLTHFLMTGGVCISVLVCGAVLLLLSGLCVCAGSISWWVCRLSITHTPVCVFAFCP